MACNSISWFAICKILYEANHYTDSIGNDLQQSIEKILKSILAVENKKIPKSHDLLEVYESINDKIKFEDDEFLILAKATEYHKEDRYPKSKLLFATTRWDKRGFGFYGATFC